MSNVIREIQESLNRVTPLKVDIAPSITPTPTALPSIPVAAPTPLPQAPPIPVDEPVVPSQVGAPLPVPDTDALSFGETVSKMSADSASRLRSLIESSGAPKPNDVQKQLLGNQTPVQIDPKLSSQGNPFSNNQPKNAQERLMFEPPVLANGLGNPFSDKQAIAAVNAGVSKGEYLEYKKAVEAQAAANRPLFNLGIESSLRNRLPTLEDITDSFEGKNAEQIRAIMARTSGYVQARRAFNQSILPLAGSGDNRSELETLFAALALPANLVKGAALDITRAGSAVVSGGFNWEQIKKDYEAMRPTQGGTFFGAAALGADFSFMSQVDEKDRPFNPLAAVRDDNNLFQVGAAFLGDVLADPLNIPAVETRLFGLFGRKPSTPLSTPPNPVQSDRVIVPPTRQGTILPYTPPRKMLPAGLDTPMSPILPQRTGNVGMAIPLPELRVPDAPTPTGAPLPVLEVVIERPRLPDLSAISNDIATGELLKRAEPVQLEFPTVREPYTPLLDSAFKVTEADVNLYNNVTALFNDSPDLPIVQKIMRDVVEQKEVVEVPPVVQQNPVLREVVKYAQDGDLTPNIAVLKGATADEIADIVADRLEVIRDTPFVVPELEVQPVEVPKLEFGRVTYQGSVKRIDSVSDSFYRDAATGSILNKRIRVDTLEPSTRVELENINTPTASGLNPDEVEALARQMVSADDSVRPVLVERVSPTEFALLSGELQLAAGRRAAELDPNFSLRSLIVEKGTPQYDVAIRQERAYAEISKLSDDAVLASNSTDTPTYAGSRSEQQLGTSTGRSTIDIDNITTARGGAYSREAVDRLALEFLETGVNIRPVVVRRTSPTTFELLRGNLEYLAAKRAAELNPRFTGVAAYVVDPQNADALLEQLRILDEGIPVGTSKPVVLTESVVTNADDLVEGVKSNNAVVVDDVSNWSPKESTIPVKDLIAAIDDLGVEALEIPAVSRLVKNKVGKLSDKTVKEVSQGINKAKGDEEVVRSTFNILWRKSTPEQQKLVLKTVSSAKLLDLLERVETKVTPPTLPTLQHETALFGEPKMMSLEQQNLYGFITQYDRQNMSGSGLLDRMKADASSSLGVPVERVGTILDELAGMGKVELNRTVQPYTYSVIPEREVYTNPYSDSSFDFTSGYTVVNNSSVSADDLYINLMKSSGFTTREAKAVGKHFITQEIEMTAAVTDRSLKKLITLRSLSVETVAHQKWSSKILKEIWDVATPSQKAYLMTNVSDIEQLGLERIARSNVIDDFLPPEGVFDVPC